MSFVVTARKWRPQKFEEVVGQQHISQTIKNAIANNRIAHAYLFAGPRGIGKTTTARIFAKALNCLNLKDGEPCNECAHCSQFNSGQSLDIIEIDGASNRRIEEIRTLRESVKYAPMSSKYKIYIIDEVHMLTTESFNALLKTLEEPPEHVVFIFATTDVHKMPLTIISRCQRFDFRRIEVNEIKNLLRKIADAEDIKIDDDSLTVIAKKADGALRDAQSLFDQVASFCNKNVTSEEINKMFNLIDEEIYFKISDAVLSKNFQEAFLITQQIYDNGWNFIDFANELIEHFRNILTVVVRKDTKLISTNESSAKKYLSYSDSFTESDILRILTFLSKFLYEIRTASNPKLKTEITLSMLIGLESSKSISDIIKAINSGEDFSVKKKVVKESTHNLFNKNEVPEENINYAETPVIITEEPVKHKNDSSSPLSLVNVKSNWKEFLRLIESEKFTLASHLTLAEPIELIGNNIKLKMAHEDDIEIIENNNGYLKFLSEKSEAAFKTRLNFSFLKETVKKQRTESIPTDQKRKSKTKEASIDINLTEDELKIVEAIKKELGGIEIN
jgi:DNA polymerase-3 subunit gamma/tau